MKKNLLENQNLQRRSNKKIKITFLVIGILILLAGLSYLVYFGVKKVVAKQAPLVKIERLWNEYNYSELYETAKEYLQTNPFNNTVLTYYGYSCFFLAVSQTDTSLAQEYLDESINTMRVALPEANEKLVPQLQYMLGKAYFYKNTISTYYYSDLAIKYLSLALANGYEADDISEYLGLSYASLGMTMESISAFTEALRVRESDTLLLSIAEQYYKTKEYTVAEQYLFRIINSNNDDEIVLKSKNLLATIYFEKEDYEKAESEFTKIIEDYENTADAYYGLGLIYEKQGNLVKARSEWRKALKNQVNHPGALKKLANY